MCELGRCIFIRQRPCQQMNPPHRTHRIPRTIMPTQHRHTHGQGHSHRHYGEAMLSVEDAMERILRHFHTLPTESKPLLDALGQTLAEDALANHDIPPLDNSAMDGYAIQARRCARRIRRYARNDARHRRRGGGRTPKPSRNARNHGSYYDRRARTAGRRRYRAV